MQDGGETTGVLLGLHYAEEYLQEILETTYFGESADVYLCDRNGEIVASSTGDKPEGLLPNALREAGVVDGETVEKL